MDHLGSAQFTRDEARRDIADLEARLVHAAPLLLQTGLLTLLLQTGLLTLLPCEPADVAPFRSIDCTLA